nr:hypothetical protein [Tanacetum cinerariifolium]
SFALLLKCSRYTADNQRDQRGVEHKRDEAVQQGHPAQAAAADADVGDEANRAAQVFAGGHHADALGIGREDGSPQQQQRHHAKGVPGCHGAADGVSAMPIPTLIGVLREGRIPPDRRVALTPKKCVELQATYPGVRVRVQPSPHRAYTDQEYRDLGIEVAEDMQLCDLLLGVKEVAISELLPGKTYLFFSHTVKKQPHNRALLQAVLREQITLIDYELLTNAAGERIVAF